MTLLVHLLQYLSEITDTHTRNNDLILITNPIIGASLIHYCPTMGSITVVITPVHVN